MLLQLYALCTTHAPTHPTHPHPHPHPQGVDKVVAFSASTATPVQYASFDTQRTDWVRHARVGYEQQQTLARPLTTAQEVGWHAPKPEPPGATARRTLGSTDVTQREGNTAASYYGHFICN